ncbi:hypothetical protein [Dyella telluris]|uniref:Uncharacterized protein n=1 Tax=Dyella telluris TaxID=2763498 RepID=A0A7G8Q2J5_9GAMM|nr:hypothetical protein [Dyella telluris]QNK01003.1 hypothetical protein H8F01_18330 [Dyella telluris]
MSDAGKGIFDEARHVTVLRRMRLIKPEHRAEAGRRILFAVAIGWLPLAIICLVEWLFLHSSSSAGFFSDVAAYARFLLAVPILILSDYIILPRLEAIAQYFVHSGLVLPDDRQRFDEAIASARRMSLGVWPSLGMAIVVYSLVITIGVTISPQALLDWQRADGPLNLSVAGWWNLLVSSPLVLGLILSWLWRLGVWMRFLHLLSRMQLRLVPSHPDKAAGLEFVALSPRIFAPLAFAIGVLTAGTLGNEVVHLHLDPMDHIAVPVATAIVVVALLISPPLLFARTLMLTRRRGVFEYGALARQVGAEFEAKWLDGKKTVDTSALSEPDFSATTDLYSVAANVYAMQPTLFDPRVAASVAIATLVPFAPIWLAAIPTKVLLTHLIGLLV